MPPFLGLPFCQGALGNGGVCPAVLAFGVPCGAPYHGTFYQLEEDYQAMMGFYMRSMCRRCQ